MQVYELDFRGAKLLCITERSQVYIPIAPICDAIGIDTTAQIQRVKRDPVLAKSGLYHATPSATGGSDAFCLPLRRLHYWLAGINSSRIKDAAMRDRVIAYQEECADALFAYFMPQYAAIIGVNCPTLHARLLQNDLFDYAAQPTPESIKVLRPRGWGYPFGYNPDDP